MNTVHPLWVRIQALKSKRKGGPYTPLPTCSSLETPRPYLEIEESAVAPVNGLCGATGPRDPDDVDLQAGAEMAVNTEAASPPPGL